MIRCARRVREDVMAVLSFHWGPPPSEKSSRYHQVVAPAQRSRTHVSAFALVVYWHDPDGTPIVAARFPQRGGAEADFMEPPLHPPVNSGC